MQKPSILTRQANFPLKELIIYEAQEINFWNARVNRHVKINRCGQAIDSSTQSNSETVSEKQNK